MSRQTKLVNKTNIPEHEIEKIARCCYPDIVRDFMNEDIQREFAERQAEQAARLATLKLHKGTSKNSPFGFWPNLLFQQCALKRPQYIQYSDLSNTFVETKSLGQNLKKQFLEVAIRPTSGLPFLR